MGCICVNPTNQVNNKEFVDQGIKPSPFPTVVDSSKKETGNLQEPKKNNNNSKTTVFKIQQDEPKKLQEINQNKANSEHKEEKNSKTSSKSVKEEKKSESVKAPQAVENKSDKKSEKKSEKISEINWQDKVLNRIKNKNFVNITLVGDKSVGKSAYVIKYIDNYFEKIYIPTLVKEISCQILSFNSHRYKIKFTVTSGNEYKEDYSKFFEESDFFLIFFDYTEPNTFQAAKHIYEEIQKYKVIFPDETSNMVIVGNKIDLNQKLVNAEEIKKFVDKEKLVFVEMSVKSGKNVREIIQNLIKSYDSVAYPL